MEALEVVIGMRKSMFAFLALFLLATLVSIQKVDIPAVRASPDIYQGDLILTNNNVTVIEGRFDINGSIIVEDNATLILRNAILNFTQTEFQEFSMTFQNPAYGNPHLIIENSTITSAYYMQIQFFGNSTASIDNLTLGSMTLILFDSSVLSVSDSSLSSGIHSYDFSTVNVSSSSMEYIELLDDSNVNMSDSIATIHVLIHAHSINCSIIRLKQGFISYWNFRQNCSVKVAPSGAAPNLTLTDTQINGFGFSFSGSSNTTIDDSDLHQIFVRGLSVVSIYNSSFNFRVSSYDNSILHFYNSIIYRTRSYEDSVIWLANSTSNIYEIKDQSKVYVCWYLDVHVVDSIGQDVPSADVTATYPNATIADSEMTNTNGWARLVLMEKMKNATGEDVIGNYVVEATYESHSNSTETGMMTENKQITIQLPFIIPEFPSLLILPLFMIATILTATIYRRKRAI